MAVVQLMLKQLSEKIDKVRQIAGNQLQDILYRAKDKLDLPEKDLLFLIFVDPAIEEAKAVAAANGVAKEKVGTCYLPWRNADYTYKQLIALVDSESYAEAVLEGWVISAGGITESTLRASSNSLIQYLAQAAPKKKARILGLFLNIIKRNRKTDRVLVPVITTLGTVYQGNYMSDPGLAQSAAPVLQCFREEARSRNIVKVP